MVLAHSRPRETCCFYPGAASSPWWNHDFLSDELCIGDSGDCDDGRVVTMKKNSLIDAQTLKSDQAAKETQERTRTADF
jgi:hypothetical protein